MLWQDVRLAFRNVVRQRRRSAIATGAIAFGLAALILANGFIESILFEFREDTIQSQLGHLQIVRPNYHDAGKADPYAFLLPNKIPELEVDTESSRIKAIIPRLSLTGLISHRESTLSFIGDGEDPRGQAAFMKGLQITDGLNLSAVDPLGVIVGEGLARNLGIRVGDRVVLMSSTATKGINAVEVRVRGFFSTVSKSYDDIALRMPIDTARRLLRINESHVWMVLLKDTSQTDIVLEELNNKLPKDEFEIVPWYELADFYNKTVTLFIKQIHGVRLIIAVIILLSVTNTMTISVMERIGEIGTSMALGITRTGIMRLFLSEGVLLGCLGGLLGLLTGKLLAGLISNIGIPMPPPPGTTHGYTAQILFSWDTALESFLLVICTAAIASIYPAWRGSRMKIVDSLRYNR
jgi:putative ABC transport system permease protein